MKVLLLWNGEHERAALGVRVYVAGVVDSIGRGIVSMRRYNVMWEYAVV